MTPSERPPVPVDLAPETLGPSRFDREINVDGAFIRRLAGVCASVDTDQQGRVEAGRDWWPLGVVWAAGETAPAYPAVVARPSTSSEVAAVLAVCADSGVPVTAAGGHSGVCGGCVPVFGGVSLDLLGLAGLVEVDETSRLVAVRAGTFGATLEGALQTDHSLTLGHWPQSMAISTVGGWVACRGAGQYSTRYGKIEDMVVGLEVALADGRLIQTGNRGPRAATGPDLSQIFIGSEGTLGVITEARLRARPRPMAEAVAAFAFVDFAAGLDACRRILARGATPAVLRLYDEVESARSFSVEGGAVLIVLDEGDPALITGVMTVVADECHQAVALDDELVVQWRDHRDALPPLESLVRAGIVADTVEVAASWAALPGIYRDALERLTAVEGTIAASAHQSHAYPDGGCLYFTFAGRPSGDRVDITAAERYYRQAWDAVMAATMSAGGALSHHHGIGLNRGRYLREYLGPAFEVLIAIKAALDPVGVLNPGKLGLPSPFGPPPWS